jgi:glycosyltransferase EpsD
MKKILFVANIHKHFRAFHIPYIEYLKKDGYEVHVAANDSSTLIPEADKQFDLPINRSPFSKNNIIAIKKLKTILAEEKYSLIHCHTAMGSVVARLAARRFRARGSLKVLYTVHGFHFYKGSSKLYWMLYYPIEKYLSRYTDGLITINDEDYKLAISNNFKCKNIFKTFGIGINNTKFNNVSFDNRIQIRKMNGYPNDSFIIIYIAEFIHRKNHKFILDSIPLLKEKIDNFKFIFAGRGLLKEELEKFSNIRGLTENVDFLGFRRDIGELISMSDIGVSVSKQEGLPMNIAEEMFAGKPIIASKIRGHVDLIEHGVNGFLYTSGDRHAFVSQISELYKNRELYNTISKNVKKGVKKYELSSCLEEMKLIYKEFI